MPGQLAYSKLREWIQPNFLPIMGAGGLMASAVLSVILLHPDTQQIKKIALKKIIPANK